MIHYFARTFEHLQTFYYVYLSLKVESVLEYIHTMSHPRTVRALLRFYQPFKSVIRLVTLRIA